MHVCIYTTFSLTNVHHGVWFCVFSVHVLYVCVCPLALGLTQPLFTVPQCAGTPWPPGYLVSLKASVFKLSSTCKALQQSGASFINSSIKYSPSHTTVSHPLHLSSISTKLLILLLLEEITSLPSFILFFQDCRISIHRFVFAFDIKCNFIFTF